MGKMLYVIFNLKTDIIWNINYYYIILLPPITASGRDSCQ